MAPNPKSEAPQPVTPEKSGGRKAESPQQEQTVGQLIENAIARLDKQAGLSDAEKGIKEKAFAKIRQKHEDVLDKKINTHGQLAQLKEELDALIDLSEIPVGDRTDSSDRLVDDIATTVRRAEIDQKVSEKVKGETSMEDIETVGDIRKLSTEQLVKLEKTHEGILLYAFSDAAGDGQQIDIENFYFNPTANTQLRISFRGNDQAERTLGAADILPPSVRCITVYQDGNQNLARTSTRRVGLKGLVDGGGADGNRTKQGTGFFDEDGYITIFTGDVVVIGGDKKDPKGVDLDFDKKYRGEKGGLDFDKYQKDLGEDEEKFIEGVRQKGLPIQKEYTPQDLQQLEASINASGVRKKVVEAAMAMLSDRTSGSCCWDWIKRVYDRAGATFQTVYKGYNYIHNLTRNDPGFENNPNNPAIVKDIEPGDWTYTQNGNAVDSRKSHSAVFLRWIDKANLIGEAASQPHSGAGGRIHKVDFKKTPVVWIMKPKQKRGFTPAQAGA